MKTRYIIMMSLATLAISCSQKEEDKLFNERPAYDVFYAKMENADTKVFADDLLRVLWDADDRVSIFNKYTYNQEYRFNGETGDNAGAFKIVESEDFVTGNALDKVYSVYPYIESTKIDNDGLITIDMPAEQKYREDSFGIGANTMIAISENNQLMFKNLCGYMIVKLYGDDVTVKSLTIKGNKGESISGKANVTAEIDKVPEISFAETATKSITLTCDTPVKIGSTSETATPFWIVVPPLVFSEGFTLTVTAADGGVYSKSTSNKFEITRNGISRMSALETLPMYPVEVVIDIVEYAKTNGWQFCENTGEQHSTVSKGGVTFTASWVTDIPNGVFFASVDDDGVISSGDWRFYQARGGGLYMSVPQGCELSKVTFSYGSTKGGILMYSTGIPIPSGTSCELSGQTAMFTVGNNTGASNGQVRIQKIVVECNMVDHSSNSSLISFADPIAKYACVEMFDADHDGEVSYDEAGAATSLSGLFTNWNTVTSFDEIKYFTGVISISGVFTGLTKLTHITIPSWITTFGTNCFDGCSALKDVTLPTGITSIPSYCFRGCATLESFVIPSTVTSIGNYAFSGCTLLSGIELPSGLQTIGNSAFQNCQAINTLASPAALTSIGQYAFSGCSSLTSVVLPETMTTIPAYCFQNCNALTTIVWPQALTTIGNSAFAGCRFKDTGYTLELPSTVISIGSSAFGSIKHLIIPSTSPVNIASNSFSAGYTILYVPANMVDMYKVRTNWSNYADRIVAISDYPFNPIEPVGGTVGEAIDLGLSVKWASWNVGASSPEEYGAYLAWGETAISGWWYDWDSYKWSNGDYNKLTKYCPSNKTDYWDGSGTPDNKVALDLEDDAAHVSWGGSWRMPTDEEWTELRNNCTWTWTSNYNNTGIAGRIVTSKKSGYTNKSIFLPAAGYREDSSLNGVGSYGYYWSSSLNTNYPLLAWDVGFSISDVRRDYYFNRYYGLSVRPVSE